jgi:hypothetical protein
VVATKVLIKTVKRQAKDGQSLTWEFSILVIITIAKWKELEFVLGKRLIIFKAKCEIINMKVLEPR